MLDFSFNGPCAAFDKPRAGFPDPFLDFASTALPPDMRRGMRLSEFLFLANPFIAAAARRVVTFFATDLAITRRGKSLGTDEQQKWQIGLKYDLAAVTSVPELGTNFECYGNLFISIVERFRRFLVCKGCSARVALEEVLDDKKRYRYKWVCPKWHMKCPSCGHEGVAKHRDIRLPGIEGLALKIWSPHEMEIAYSEATNKRRYFWRPSAELSGKVRRGDPDVLLETPYEFIQTVARRGLLRFDDDYIYHAWNPAPAGIKHGGWGLPKNLVNFRTAWYLQLLLRQNEGIIIDYLMPIRAITPETQGSSPDNDPYGNYYLGNLRQEISDAIVNHRTDPLSYSFFSQPVKYQLWGGEAKDLAPSELIDQAVSMLLNSCDIPVEMYKGNLQLQTALQAIQLFTQNQTTLVSALNGAMRFIAKRVSQSLAWEPVAVELTQPALINDIQIALAKLQMAQQQQVSLTDALKVFGFNFEDQARKISDERQLLEKENRRVQEESDSAAVTDQIKMPPQGGQQPAGAPAPGGGGAPQDPGAVSAPRTVEEVEVMAGQIASYLKTRDQSSRSSYLRHLKSSSPTLHAAVIAGMKNIDQQASTFGKSQYLQQNYGMPA
jgi:hypothetical protein